MHPSVAPTSSPPFSAASLSIKLSHLGSNRFSRRVSPAARGERSVKHGVPAGPGPAAAAADDVAVASAVNPYDTRRSDPVRTPSQHADALAALRARTPSRSSRSTSAARAVAIAATRVSARSSHADAAWTPPRSTWTPPIARSRANAAAPSARSASGPASGESFPGSSASAATKLTVRADSSFTNRGSRSVSSRFSFASGLVFNTRVSPRDPKARATYPSDRTSLRGSSGSSVILARSSSGSDLALASPRTTRAPMASAAAAPATKSAP